MALILVVEDDQANLDLVILFLCTIRPARGNSAAPGWAWPSAAG
jgi:hypothetical protein